MPTLITGTLVDAATNPVTSGTFVRFQLRGHTGIQPVITGVGAMTPGAGSGREYFVDFTPNASGVISGSVYSTRDATGLLAGEITVNGNGTACWWEVSIYRNAKKVSSTHVHAKKGVTLDVGNLTALSTTPVATAPSGDSTYARLDGSNTPFTGVIQFLQGILLALGKSVAWSTDLFLGRGAAGTLTVGTTAGASDGTVSAATYQVGGVSQSGTGPLAATGSPVFTTPNIGVATATSVNKLTLTQPATGATLTILDGKTAKVDNTLEFAGPDASVQTFQATGTIVSRTSTDTLTNKTLTAPVINGTPTGTGIPTLTLKKGSGAGNYTSTSLTAVQVDGTNLAFTVTIPIGWKLSVQASGSIGSNTASVTVAVSITDGGTKLQEVTALGPTAAGLIPFSISSIITGDGASHTIDLRFFTTNASDAVAILNASSNQLPTMVFNLSPSN
jgi:hypothetical protein